MFILEKRKYSPLIFKFFYLKKHLYIYRRKKILEYSNKIHNIPGPGAPAGVKDTAKQQNPPQKLDTKIFQEKRCQNLVGKNFPKNECHSNQRKKGEM